MKRKLNILSIFSFSLLIFMIGVLLTAIFGMEAYRSNYLNDYLVNNIYQEEAVIDNNIFSIFYNASIVINSDKISNFKLSINKQIYFDQMISDSAVNPSIYDGISLIYNDDFYKSDSSLDTVSSYKYKDISENDKFSVIDSYKNSDGEHIVLLCCRRNDDVYVFYYIKEFVISNFFSNYSDGFSFISDENNKIISTTFDNKNILNTVYQNGNELTNGTVNKVVFNDFNYILVNKELEYTNSHYNLELSIHNFISYDYLFKSLDISRIIVLTLVSAITIVTFIIAIVLLFKIVRPIKKLSHEVENIDLKNINQLDLKKNKTNNEIAILENNFIDVVDRVQTLLDDQIVNSEKQRILELDSLQIQINPHFLYNALDAIAWMAKLNGEKDIEELVISLAKFYRLSLHKGAKYITVSEELDIIKYYLQIEMIRYPGIFNFKIDCDDNIKDGKTLKLVLQPFVENIIKYAFINYDKIFSINIKAIKDGEDIIYSIKDNGAGFDANNFDYKKAKNSFEKGGFGIHNVDERLHLEYGNKYNLKINSKINEGTEITIKIPYSEFIVSKN